jgi:Phage tail tube protein
MANLTDHQFGTGVETVYGSPVAVSRFYRIKDSTAFQVDPMPLQGEGLSVGSPGGVSLLSRRVPGIGKATGKISVELVSKGLGQLLRACVGAGSANAVAGALYQHIFTPTIVDTFLPSFTAQLGVVNNNGQSQPTTYSGCTVSQFTLSCPEQGIAMLDIDVDAKSFTTATALGISGYPAADSLYTFVGGSVRLGATPAFVAPTATTLASGGGTANSNVKSWELTTSNNIDDGRWVMGGRNQPTRGKVAHTLKFEYEYNDTLMRDALLNQSTLSFTATLQTTEAIGAGVATMQLAIPAIKINSGSWPEPTNGATVKTSVEADVLYDGANQPYYITMLSADTAL